MTYRDAALRVAVTQLGVTEHPPRSNWGPRVSEYLASAGLHTPAPWCMAFVHHCYKQAGLDIGGGASVGFFEDWARKNGNIVYDPKPGDVVCYRFDADNWPDHVGIVESATAKSITAVEGNTSYLNDANGGTVMRRTRRITNCVFVRIPGEVPDLTPRVDVVRDGKPWLIGQKVTSAFLWVRLKNAARTGKSITVKRAK